MLFYLTFKIPLCYYNHITKKGYDQMSEYEDDFDYSDEWREREQQEREEC